MSLREEAIEDLKFARKMWLYIFKHNHTPTREENLHYWGYMTLILRKIIKELS